MAPVRRLRGELAPETLRELNEIAEPYLDGEPLGPFTVGDGALPEFSRGVYVVLDTSGGIAYVGKVCLVLDAGRFHRRVEEHVGDPVKRASFDAVYFFPIKSEFDNRFVEHVEGWFARVLRPSIGQRAPRVG